MLGYEWVVTFFDKILDKWIGICIFANMKREERLRERLSECVLLKERKVRCLLFREERKNRSFRN